MREVISKAYAARQDEQDAEDRDWPGSFHDRKADSTLALDWRPPAAESGTIVVSANREWFCPR